MIFNSRSLNKTSIILIFFSFFILSSVIFSRLLLTVITRQNKISFEKSNVNINPKAIDIKPEETNILGEETSLLKKLPENFPADFPIYPQAEIADVWEEKGDRVNAFSVISKTRDNPGDVFKYFNKQLDFLNWEKQIILDSNDSYTISFQKERVKGFMGITKEDEDKTLISVTMGIDDNED